MVTKKLKFANKCVYIYKKKKKKQTSISFFKFIHSDKNLMITKRTNVNNYFYEVDKEITLEQNVVLKAQYLPLSHEDPV